ncbi:MAG: ankyrin repeat domain-containing protein [Hyphomicrobiaceae bacterium]
MLDRIANGRTDLVFEYVAAGNAPSSRDGNGVSLIRWCAYFGDVSAIRFLLASGEHLASLGHNFDLNGAAFHGHWQLCQYLIESGADVNSGLPDTGETPLHAALSKANRLSTEAVVSVLVAAGADPNRAAVHGAETSCFMRDCRTRGETPLHRAAAYASEAVIDLLLAAGATKDARDQNGDSPLAWASWHLRPTSILRKLCFGSFAIHPQANWTGDHGSGWTGMDAHLVGKPHI